MKVCINFVASVYLHLGAVSIKWTQVKHVVLGEKELEVQGRGEEVVFWHVSNARTETGPTANVVEMYAKSGKPQK